MRRFAYTVLAAAIVAPFAAAPALAQGADTAPFTGPRIEGIVGWDRVGTNVGHKDDVVYGIGAGYDTQMGSLVVGVDAEATKSEALRCAGGVFAAGDRLCAKAGRDLYIGGRVGTVVGSNALLYAKAGYSNARARLTYDDGTAGGAGDFRDSTNLDGVRVGAGAEYAIGPNSFVKAEYRYSNYEQGFDRHQVVGGFGFRF